MSATRVQRLSSVLEVPRAQWNGLLQPGEAPVLRHEWIAAMEESDSAIADRGWEASHFLLWRGDALIGAAPAWLKFHSLGEYVYDFGWANAAASFGVEYYPKLLIGLPLSPITARRFLVAPGESVPDVQRQLLNAAVDFARDRGCSSVHVLFSPDDEANALVQQGLFRRRTMQYHFKNAGYRSYDEYLSRFDAKRRHQLKRERAAAATQGISLKTIRSSELTPAHADLAFSFYQSTALSHGWGPVQLTHDFFLRAFASMPDAIEMVVAERQGRIIAGAFNLHSRTRLYGRYWGCFEEHPFLHFNVCLYHSINDCIELGREVFEPGAGGEHKIARGFEPTQIHSTHLIFNPKFERAVRAHCDAEGHEVERITTKAQEIAGMKRHTA